MSDLMNIEDSTHERLKQIKFKDEKYNDVITRLLDMYDLIMKAAEMIWPTN